MTLDRTLLRVVLDEPRLLASPSLHPVSFISAIPQAVAIDGFRHDSHCMGNTTSPGAFSPYTVISVGFGPGKEPLTGDSEPG